MKMFFVLLLANILLCANIITAFEENQRIILQLDKCHQFQYAGYYAAKAKGFYKEAGFDVFIKEGSPNISAVKEVSEGKADFGVSGDEVLFSKLNGASLIALDIIFQHSPKILITLNANITSPHNLVGKTIMRSSDKDDVNIDAMFSEEGVSLNSIKFTSYKSSAIEDLINARVDAIAGSINNEYIRLIGLGYKPVIINPKNYGVDFYGDMLFTNKNEIKSKNIEKFRNASLKGWEYAVSHVDEMVELIGNMESVKERNITKEMLKEEAFQVCSLICPNSVKIGHINLGRLEEMADIYYKNLGQNFNFVSLDDFILEPEKTTNSNWRQIILTILTVLFVVVGIALLWIIQLKKNVNKRTEELEKEIELHKITEESLSTERELLRNLMDNIPDTIYFKDNQSRFTRINKAQAKLLGIVNPDDAIMKTDFDFFSKEHAETAYEDEQRMMKNGEQLVDKREKIKNKDGSYKYISATKVPIYDKDGIVKGVVGISRDVSERMMVEEALIESESKYRSLFDNMVNGFAYFKILLDENKQFKDLIFLEANKVFESLYDLKRSNIIGESFSKVYPDSKLDIMNLYKQIFLKNKTISFEFYSTQIKKWLFVTGYSDKENHCSIILEDITERKNAEERILRSEKKFKTIFDYSSDGIILISGDEIVDCNSKACELFGSPHEKIIGKTPRDYSPEYQFDGTLSRDNLRRRIQDALNDKPQFFEWLCSNVNGELFFTELSMFSIDFAGEKLVQVIIRDISERKHAEEALKQRELEFRSLANNLPDFIARYDHQSRFIYVNKQFENLLGLPAKEIIGKAFSEIDLKDSSTTIQKPEIERVFKSGKINSFEFTLQLNHKPRLFESRLVPEFGIDNTVSTVLSITRDMTEMKRFEEIQSILYKISESVNTTENLQTLYQGIHSSIKELLTAENFYIAIYDSEKNIISYPYWVDEYNPAPEEDKPQNGLTEYVLRSGKEMLVNEKAAIALIERGEIECCGKPAKIWLGIPLKLRDKTFGVLVVRDYRDEKLYGEDEMQILTYVSEQVAIAIDKKKSEEELIKYAKELKELNASKDKFFSIISHDLRSPFHSLLGITEIIAEDSETMSKEEIVGFIPEIYKTLKNQYRLLENLLEWSRIQTGKLEYQPVRLNLCEKVNDILNILTGNAAKKEIRLVNTIDDSIFLKADQNMVQSIIQNLVSNAIKFTPQGGKISVNAITKDDFVEVLVKDNGVGIDPKDLNKLFRIDVQFSRLGTDKEKGTGIGLNLCKELVEKHKGKIWVESEIGKGTTFMFTMPKDVVVC